MIKLLKKSKFFILTLIFIHTTSLIASELPHNIIKSESFFANKGDIIRQLYNEDGLLIYDAVFQLIEEIESGTIDDLCQDEEWYKINHFLTFLAKEGILPNATEEEEATLNKDIEEILNPYDDNISFAYSSFDSLKTIPAIYFSQPEIVLCKSWLKKQCKHIRKFVKKHKKAIIIGAVVAVAAVAVTTVIIATSAAAASAATAATAESCAPKSKNKEDKKTEPSQSPTTASDPTLEQFFNDQVNEYKNTIVQDSLSSTGKEFLDKENERIIGSSLAHNAIENISSYLPYDINDSIIIEGHGRVDNVFSTNQTPLYLDNNMSGVPTSIQENIFYLQGDFALKNNHYEQAIDSFGKAIEANPSNHNIYLDRAFAYFNVGEFDNSLQDYHTYTQQSAPVQFVNVCEDTNIAVAIKHGLVNGVKQSGKNLLLFAAESISHPINTLGVVNNAVVNVENNLANLVLNSIVRPIETVKDLYRAMTDPNE